MSLTQFVWTMHKICKVRGLNPNHHQKTIKKINNILKLKVFQRIINFASKKQIIGGNLLYPPIRGSANYFKKIVEKKLATPFFFN